VTVTLLADGTPVMTTTTASNGGYDFWGVTAGSYTVRQTEIPSYTLITANPVNISLEAKEAASASFGNRAPLPLADLSLVKSLAEQSGTLVNPGGLVTYTLVLSNAGLGAATGVVITDPLPVGLAYGMQVDSGTVILPRDTLLSWGPAYIPGQMAYTITFTAMVTDSVAFAGQDVVNTAYFSADNHAPGASNSVTFTIAAPPNTAPTISNIANQFTEVSTPLTVSFTISDAETAPDDLLLSQASDNAALVPEANIVFSGSGTERMATITPTASMTGTATLTFTVSDGERSASEGFVLSVGVTPPANTPPTISAISNQFTEVSTPLTVSFTISDVETAPDDLVLGKASDNAALLSEANIVFSGSGTERMATITPTTGMTGTAAITFTVSDGELSGNEGFVLAVGVNVPPEFTSEPVLAATVGSPYLYTITTYDANGDTLSITTTTALPGWLALVDHGDGTATLSGTPTMTGTYAIALAVSDGEASDTQDFSITVEEGPANKIYLPLLLRNASG